MIDFVLVEKLTLIFESDENHSCAAIGRNGGKCDYATMQCSRVAHHERERGKELNLDDCRTVSGRRGLSSAGFSGELS